MIPLCTLYLLPLGRPCRCTLHVFAATCNTAQAPLSIVLFSSRTEYPQNISTWSFHLKPSLPQTRHPIPSVASFILCHLGNLNTTMPSHVQSCNTSSLCMYIIATFPGRQGLYLTYFYISLISPVLVNFMYQLDWITRCPDIWLNITSRCVCEGVSG